MILKKYYAIMLAIITWFALILQLILLKESIFNFFSYFTILSNLLIAVSLSASLTSPQSKIGKFISSITSQTAIALYILIVGIVYNTVLRGIWEPKGWQLMADNLLHVIIPILYIIYWSLFVPKGTLNWKDGISWTYFPLVYLIYSLIRGHFVNWYPYPFLNVPRAGYIQVLINAGVVVVAFVFFALLMIGVDKLMKNKDL